MNFASNSSANNDSNDQRNAPSLFQNGANGNKNNRNENELTVSNNNSTSQSQHATHSVNENDENLDNHILLIGESNSENSQDNQQNSNNVAASVINTIIRNDNHNSKDNSTINATMNDRRSDNNNSNNNNNNQQSYYNHITSNIPESRYTVKKWFASHPERQTELVNLFIDQLTWTNHLNFTEAIKMLRTHFDFPFSGARVLKRQYNSLILNLEKKINDGVQLDEFDVLVMRLKDKKKECDESKISRAAIKRNKMNEFNDNNIHQQRNSMQDISDLNDNTDDDDDEDDDEDDYEEGDEDEDEDEQDNVYKDSTIIHKPNHQGRGDSTDRSQNDQTSIDPRQISTTILNNIQRQIQSRFPNSMANSNLANSNSNNNSQQIVEVAVLKEKVQVLQTTVDELKKLNTGYQAIIAEKNEHIKKKDEAYTKLVDSFLKLQEDFQSTIKEVFSKL